jgi:hypothetical protein
LWVGWAHICWPDWIAPTQQLYSLTTPELAPLMVQSNSSHPTTQNEYPLRRAALGSYQKQEQTHPWWSSGRFLGFIPIVLKRWSQLSELVLINFWEPWVWTLRASPTPTRPTTNFPYPPSNKCMTWIMHRIWLSTTSELHLLCIYPPPLRIQNIHCTFVHSFGSPNCCLHHHLQKWFHPRKVVHDRNFIHAKIWLKLCCKNLSRMRFSWKCKMCVFPAKNCHFCKLQRI